MRRTVRYLALTSTLACLACRGDFDGGGDGGADDGSDGSGGSSADDGSGSSSGSGDGSGSGTGGSSAEPTDSATTSDDCGSADFDNDPENCGYCGHSCVGGECFEGQCQPVLLTEDWGYEIAVGGEWIYWTRNEGGSSCLILRTPTIGGIPEPVAEKADTCTKLVGLELDASYVYVAHGGDTDGRVFRAPLGGGTLTALDEGTTEPVSIADMAIDGQDAYWIETSPALALYRVSLEGGTATPMIADLPAAAMAMAVGEDAVYWVTFEITTDAGDGTVMRAEKDGGGTYGPIVSEEVYRPQDVAVDGTSVYWTDFASKKVRKVSTDGGPVDDLALGLTPYTLAVDDVAVYWADDAPPKIQTVPLDGGTVTTLAEDLPTSPEVIALDDKAVYWASGNPDPAAAIWKVAKP